MSESIQSVPEGFVGPVDTPLDALGRDIAQGIEEHRFTDAQTAQLTEIVHDHGVNAVGTLQDFTVDARADTLGMIGDAKDAAHALEEAHGGTLDGAHLEPREVITVVEPLAHGFVTVEGDAVTAVYDVTQERLDTWRDLVDARAEMGDESAATISAQHAQVEQLQAQLDADRTHFEDGMDAAHGNIDATVDYTVEHNQYPADVHQVSDTPHYGDAGVPDGGAEG